MRLIIIETPYAGNRRANMAYLKACLRDSLLRGEAPYASHAIYTQQGVLDDSIPEERSLGIEAGFAWHRLADASVVYYDLGVSAGMRKGIANAKRLGIPVVWRSLISRG